MPDQRRRQFITLLGGAAVAWALTARAQEPAKPAIGFLHVGSPEPIANRVAAFRKGLSETGYLEGQNVAIDYHWAYGDSARLPDLAADLVRRRVAVIVAPGGMAAVLAAKAATTTIPIVFETSLDPVEVGLVASLNRPGNITGVSSMNTGLGAKRLGLLQELLPTATRFAALINRNVPTVAEAVITDMETAASTVGRQVDVLTAGTNSQIDAAFASLVQKRVDALLVGPDPLFNTRRVQIVVLAAHHKIPAIYYVREFAEAGGLMSYGTNVAELFREVGIYTGRVLRGEKPAGLLARADEVIE
jgi:putative ABC transport system substrate-binding protein